MCEINNWHGDFANLVTANTCVLDYLNAGVSGTDELIKLFIETVTSIKATPSSRFVIMLDSIDQLRDNKTAFDLSW